jgi:hypothetical protein
VTGDADDEDDDDDNGDADGDDDGNGHDDDDDNGDEGDDDDDDDGDDKHLCACSHISDELWPDEATTLFSRFIIKLAQESFLGSLHDCLSAWNHAYLHWSCDYRSYRLCCGE